MSVCGVADHGPTPDGTSRRPIPFPVRGGERHGATWLDLGLSLTAAALPPARTNGGGAVRGGDRRERCHVRLVRALSIQPASMAMRTASVRFRAPALVMTLEM
ncbi:hypothetical protein Misp01_09740 [Microtetraspora sp. NBRC 13810]|nr:hypothetical protein Misp01_09740 [Microtetraspora sp. NBRC 13810]